jgi:hypothetical protein
MLASNFVRAHIQRMETHPEILALERMAADAKLNMTQVLITAAVNPSTWHRWRKHGMEPKIRTLRRVEAAIRQAVAS